jgi:hypothetical protein
MSIAVTLGAKTTLGNVTRYAFSVTRNTVSSGATPPGTRYTSDDVQKSDVQKRDLPKKTTESNK